MVKFKLAEFLSASYYEVLSKRDMLVSDATYTIAGIPHSAIQSTEGLRALDEAFREHLKGNDSALDALDELQVGQDILRDRHSHLIMQLGPKLEAFLSLAMGYEKQMQPYRESQARYATIQRFKRDYLFRRIKPRLTRLPSGDFKALSDPLWEAAGCTELTDWEYALSSWGLQVLESKDSASLALLEAWCASACLTDAGKAWIEESLLFSWPKRLNPNQLLSDFSEYRSREGFDLQDSGLSEEQQHDHAHYCLDCHSKSGDFCSIGFPVKKGDVSQGYREHASGELMLGCPLEEHVGEMHELFAGGHPIAALAAAMVNNPLIALTGHRVCNDCMKSCVYQKQTPVNTPGVESGLLQWALALPWGVELVALLMRWNPLRYWQPIEKSKQGRSVAVMGTGPAGIAMMHHLLMEGCDVVAFDGAKLSAVPNEWCDQPIKEYASICRPLSERPARGFGGVSEYGITVRWDKNLLTLLHVLFQRHSRATLIGSVRFGGALTVDSFWPLGFDHLCLALGAGLPKELRIPNSLAIGMRQASDFLMSLQLNAAGHLKSLCAFQMRLPALVIGGGLTAVDAASEAMAYYLQLIETVSIRYYALCKTLSELKVRGMLSVDDLLILDEWLLHANAWHQEKERANSQSKQADSVAFIKRLGGVSIVYRRSMKESPAYKRNHEELDLCLESGVSYLESLQPHSVVCDELGHVSALSCLPVSADEEGHLVPSGDPVELPARCILTATGAKPNVAYEFEYRGTFQKHQGHYQPYGWNEEANAWQEDRSEGHFKQASIGMLTSYNSSGHRVSLLGDSHWRYQGTVVQAIASARRALPQVMRAMHHIPKQTGFDRQALLKSFDVRVLSNQKVTQSMHLLTLSCSQIASRHAAGQFYRLIPSSDSFQSDNKALLGSRMGSDGCLSFVLSGDSPSTRLLKKLKSGDSCDLMGPTGAWAHQPSNPEHVLVIGGDLAFAFLRSVSPEWQKQGHRITWLSTLSERELLELSDCLPSLEAKYITSADLVLPGDCYPKQFSAVYAIGDPILVRSVRLARKNNWNHVFSEACRWVGAVYGPMQCQLKGVCAQCLQWQIDPSTGERTKAVYACSWQHQPMDVIDLDHLSERATQSQAIDSLNALWFEECVDNAL